MPIRADRLPPVFYAMLMSLVCACATGQENPQVVATDKPPAAGMAKDPRLFESHATLAVSIDAPLDLLDKRRNEDETYPGKLRYTDGNGQLREFDIKLQARGKFRRRFDICRFPPIRLNFRKQQVKKTVFRGQNKLKMVTHCQNNRTLYENYLLKEYLAYRMYQQLTDYSFRVRLLRVRWTDSNNPGEVLEHYAFLLEDEGALAKRLDLPLSDARSSTVERLVPQQSVIVSVFQYMIANTDFSLIRGPAGDTCCHNIILFQTDDGDLPVPYDFDFSGFVNARYAGPNPKFKLKSITERLYRGRCEHNDQLDSVLQHFEAQRAALFELINAVEGIKSSTRGRARRFVEKFYKTIGNPKKVQSKLIRKCA